MFVFSAFRYTCTLREYLLTQSVNVHESTLLLTQLMEAIVHLGDNDIAHRWVLFEEWQHHFHIFQVDKANSILPSIPAMVYGGSL